ncbi:hypothetical protein [Microcoleus asticus]|uniref:Uncharacterized protein n=1 Tax=Microcoleus asticus IPMA8 TaxID=2563858 RepID=A0ABX2D5S0_9CYAN|nr:hypothetical protein [Microcoleus asticus]NQE37518.1 hypothetical protein [Microcoleus asticus IPMA8]
MGFHNSEGGKKRSPGWSGDRVTLIQKGDEINAVRSKWFLHNITPRRRSPWLTATSGDTVK